ncbi:MAG: hypothetical protein HZA91_04650 [Verrucomicrobia bacterium]|nr:hypothetical protein [Verrucomicrobiota bacterium]
MNLLPVGLDLDAMRLNLLRQKEPARVHIFEHDVADEVKDELDHRFGLPGFETFCCNNVNRYQTRR